MDREYLAFEIVLHDLMDTNSVADAVDELRTCAEKTVADVPHPAGSVAKNLTSVGCKYF